MYQNEICMTGMQCLRNHSEFFTLVSQFAFCETPGLALIVVQSSGVDAQGHVKKSRLLSTLVPVEFESD